MATLNFRAAVTAGYLAEAAYHRAVAEILPQDIAQQLDEQGLLVFRRARIGPVRTPERRDISLGGGRISYRITDEDARINLNTASPDVLHRLLIELGVEREARDVIVDSILDWKDPNEEHRLNGAESDYYLALPVPYKSKNANFDSVEELLQVRGVTRQIFDGPEARRPGECAGLADCLTVVSPGGININTASATVLRALGLAPAEAALCIAGRPYVELSSVSATCRRGGVRVRSETFRIEATGEVPGQGRRTLTVVVQRRRGARSVAQVVPLSWRWSEEEPAR